MASPYKGQVFGEFTGNLINSLTPWLNMRMQQRQQDDAQKQQAWENNFRQQQFDREQTRYDAERGDQLAQQVFKLGITDRSQFNPEQDQMWHRELNRVESAMGRPLTPYTPYQMNPQVQAQQGLDALSQVGMRSGMALNPNAPQVTNALSTGYGIDMGQQGQTEPLFTDPQKVVDSRQAAQHKQAMDVVNRTQPNSPERQAALVQIVSDPYRMQAYMDIPPTTVQQGITNDYTGQRIDIAKGNQNLAKDKFSWQQNKDKFMMNLATNKFAFSKALSESKLNLERVRVEIAKRNADAYAGKQYGGKWTRTDETALMNAKNSLAGIKIAIEKKVGPDGKRLTDDQVAYYQSQVSGYEDALASYEAQKQAAQSAGGGTGGGKPTWDGVALSQGAQNEIKGWIGAYPKKSFADLWTAVQKAHPGWNKQAVYSAWTALKKG